MSEGVSSRWPASCSPPVGCSAAGSRRWRLGQSAHSPANQQITFTPPINESHPIKPTIIWLISRITSGVCITKLIEILSCAGSQRWRPGQSAHSPTNQQITFKLPINKSYSIKPWVICYVLYKAGWYWGMLALRGEGPGSQRIHLPINKSNLHSQSINHTQLNQSHGSIIPTINRIYSGLCFSKLVDTELCWHSELEARAVSPFTYRSTNHIFTPNQ